MYKRNVKKVHNEQTSPLRRNVRCLFKFCKLKLFAQLLLFPLKSFDFRGVPKEHIRIRVQFARSESFFPIPLESAKIFALSFVFIDNKG